MIPGTSDREMAAIDVPVLVAVGENDIVREVERLPQLFTSTPELTEFVLPGSGHNHVIAAERLLLFDELGRWVGGLPEPHPRVASPGHELSFAAALPRIHR